MGLHPTKIIGKQRPDVAKLAWDGVVGYAGHIPGRDSENVHGLVNQHAKEHGIAEYAAQNAGESPDPPWFPWATSSGKYPGCSPSWRTSRNTLDKVTKPHRLYH